jgi:predicted ABC-type ATPase
MDEPILFIIAGPNGSGKTSLSERIIIESFGKSIWIINPDTLATRIASAEDRGLEEANLEAVKRIETWLTASVDAHQTVGVETVLSTAKYRKLVRAARKRKFRVFLIYVILESPDKHVARVKLRVAKGGHNVPKDKIIDRRARSLKQLPWFLTAADAAWLYDNSGAGPRLMGEKIDGKILPSDHALPEIATAMREAAEISLQND